MPITIIKSFPTWRRRACRAGRGANARSALAIFLVAGAFPNAGARAASCESAPPAVVTVEARSSEVHEEFDTTGDEIRRVAAARGVQPHWPALGAYISEVRYRADISQNAQLEDSGLYCATPGAVRLFVSLDGRVIHLARELKGDRCLKEIVRRHEQSHADADEQAFKQVLASSSALRTSLAHLEPARAASAAIAKASVRAAVERYVSALFDRLDGDRARLNRMLNSPRAIAQLREQCEGR